MVEFTQPGLHDQIFCLVVCPKGPESIDNRKKWHRRKILTSNGIDPAVMGLME
jgi:hypothetical protein